MDSALGCSLGGETQALVRPRTFTLEIAGIHFEFVGMAGQGPVPVEVFENHSFT